MPALSFVDQVKIYIKAGDGGNGKIGFHRAKYVPKGGPDGGDGGKGGDIILRASKHKSTLYDYRKRRHFKAKNGGHGGTTHKTGASADPVVVEVPPGTLVHDEETGDLLAEVLAHGEEVVLQKGGKGGLGNIHFKSSVNQSPQKATPGKVIEGRWVILELKLLADIGIIGKPNAGKSTLLSQLSKTKTKIGDYPFTTLHPFLGVCFHDDKRLTFADMPGLLEGAHQNVGLGFQFLKHIERTQTLLYLIEINPDNPDQSYEDYVMLNNEIKEYNADLLQKKSLVVLNKCDLLDTDEQQEDYIKAFKRKKIKPLFISAESKTGLGEMLEYIYKHYA